MKEKSPSPFEICILAGGLSRRMGRDKSRLKLGGRTMMAHVRATARALGLPVRVIRRDAVPRCGPLGGVFTGLKSTKADAIMFLACDMPFVGEMLLRAVRQHFDLQGRSLFVRSKGKPGFPFVLRREALTIVASQIEAKRFSLHELARLLSADSFPLSAKLRTQLENINTPEEWERAVRVWNNKLETRRAKRET